jgi:gephyrin
VYPVITLHTHSPSLPLPQNTIYRINTGGSLPQGADAVIMVEDTVLVSGDVDGEEREVSTRVQLNEGENVRNPGSDVRAGELVLKKGEVISSKGGEIATLAFVGRKVVRRFQFHYPRSIMVRQVEVYKKPVVAILSTGNELVDIRNDPGTGGGTWIQIVLHYTQHSKVRDTQS